MPSSAAKPLHLPWHTAERYWLCVFPREGVAREEIAAALKGAGYTENTRAGCLQAATPQPWLPAWQALFQTLTQHALAQHVDVSIFTGEGEPDEHTGLGRKTVSQVQSIADNLWLGDAVLQGRLFSYLQPVMEADGKVFGYESFARALTGSGTLITGEAIVRASKALGVEYGIDRLLHVRAIDTFAESGCRGVLFVNFFPGFIQRPEIYLEALSETVEERGLEPSRIVLDFTRCETPYDTQHLKRVTAYCRDRAYAIAMDDIESVAGAKSLLQEVMPDYLKLDARLARAATKPEERDDIAEIVEQARRRRARVIAEGVETEEIYAALRSLGVDLFQGYFFAPPLSLEQLRAQGAA